MAVAPAMGEHGGAAGASGRAHHCRGSPEQPGPDPRRRGWRRVRRATGCPLRAPGPKDGGRHSRRAALDARCRPMPSPCPEAAMRQARGLLRVTRRGGQRKGPRPARNRGRRSGELACAEAIDAGGGLAVHRARHPDAVPGPGIPAGRLVPRRSALDWHQAQQYRGIVRLYRDLIAARRNLRGESAGLLGHGHRVFHVDEANKVIAFQRWSRDDEQDAVVIVVNLSHCTHDHYAMGSRHRGAGA